MAGIPAETVEKSEETAPAVEEELVEAPEPTTVGEPAAEEEAPEAEATDPLLAAIAAVKDDPELAEKFREALNPTPEELDEEQAKTMASQSYAQRLAAVGSYAQQAGAYDSQNVMQSAGQWFGDLAQYVEAQAKTLMEKGEGDTAILDPGAMAEQVANLAVDARERGRLYGAAQTVAAVMDALESTPAYRHLNQQERQHIASKDATLPSVIQTFVGAALRAAPKEITKAAQVKADKEAKNLERAEKLMAVVGARTNANGLSPKAPDSRSKNERLGDPTTPIEELVKLVSS